MNQDIIYLMEKMNVKNVLLMVVKFVMGKKVLIFVILVFQNIFLNIDKAADGLCLARFIDRCQWLPEFFVRHHLGAKVRISHEKTKLFFGILLTN